MGAKRQASSGTEAASGNDDDGDETDQQSSDDHYYETLVSTLMQKGLMPNDPRFEQLVMRSGWSSQDWDDFVRWRNERQARMHADMEARREKRAAEFEAEDAEFQEQLQRWSTPDLRRRGAESAAARDELRARGETLEDGGAASSPRGHDEPIQLLGVTVGGADEAAGASHVSCRR